MKNETVKCPFCFKESEHGVLVCTGCHSTISYGLVPAKYAVIYTLLIIPCVYFTLIVSQSFLIGIITLIAPAIFLRFYLRNKFSDRVVFSHKN
ncbi:TPA: hypothetical protein ACPDQB_001221 [Yersinia enterocolitica]